MKFSLLTLNLAVLSVGSCIPRQEHDFQYAVIFGDSYTDDGRGEYYGTHGSQSPPAGTYPPEVSVGSSGGLVWPQYVGNYTGATIYDYAIGGAVCSNELIARYNPFLGHVIPSVIDDQVPSFEADKSTALYEDSTADNTVYGLWIGTNDLGLDAFLTDSEVTPGTNLTSYIDCLWSTFDHIYKAGGRRFVILNNNALQLSPLYQDPAKGGAGNNRYWGNKESYNATEYNQKMLEYVVMTNRLISSEVPFFLEVENRWPDAKFAVYDVYSLVVDIINDPEAYLEAPYDVQGFYNDCPSGCPADRLLNGYLWYDELHPSNKTQSYVAKEFVGVASGTSKYGTYWNY